MLRPALAACPQRLQVASVNLDLIDSHLNEQDVADDAVWSLLRHQLQHGSFHFAVAGPPPFGDVQDVCRIPKSTARKRDLDPSRVERMRITNLLAERTAEALSTVRLWEGFLVVQPRACSGSLPRLTWRLMLRWHVLGAPTSGFRRLIPLARPSVRLCIRRWRRCAVSRVPGPKVVSSRHKGHHSIRKGPSAVLCPLPITPASLTPAMQPPSPITCARTLPSRAQRLWDLARQWCRQRHVQAVVLPSHGSAQACS